MPRLARGWPFCGNVQEEAPFIIDQVKENNDIIPDRDTPPSDAPGAPEMKTGCSRIKSG